jgi:chloramphenicol O-acetyltransferase type A
MKSFLDIDSWNRKEHFHFFKKFDEPFFGMTANIDCTNAYTASKFLGASFFIYYLHKTLIAVNSIEPFRYRISDNRIAVWDRIDGSATISREDGTFGFSLVEFNSDFNQFNAGALVEIERVKNTPGLITRDFSDDNLIHFSAIPWVDFTSLSHARNYSLPDSCPKISFGKMTLSDSGRRSMPMSVHVHHALMDGFHVGKFIDVFQDEMKK